ncbi:MAG: sigma factor-like helix-turn-helix DNA-binding protein [Candidatus Woesearchaeota archaeon]
MLTSRELEVLTLRKDNRTQQEVAAQLGISQAAVSSFENNAKKKIEDAKETLRQASLLGYS